MNETILGECEFILWSSHCSSISLHCICYVSHIISLNWYKTCHNFPFPPVIFKKSLTSLQNPLFAFSSHLLYGKWSRGNMLMLWHETLSFRFGILQHSCFLKFVFVLQSSTSTVYFFVWIVCGSTNNHPHDVEVFVFKPLWCFNFRYGNSHLVTYFSFVSKSTYLAQKKHEGSCMNIKEQRRAIPRDCWAMHIAEWPHA